MTEEEKQERLKGLKEELLDSLKKEYGNIPVTTLESLTKEIKVIPSVRSGNTEKRDTTNYYELSPTKRNKYNELLLQDRELGPANSRLVEKYALQYGDLLVSYRGCRSITIGRFAKKETPKPAVGAVSNILIRFEEKESESLSLLVHKYLTDGPAQRYLRFGATNPDHGRDRFNRRYLLSKEYLADIPIPDFRVLIQENPIDKLYYTQKDLLTTIMHLYSTISKIRTNIMKTDESLLQIYLKNNSALPKTVFKNRELLEQLILLEEQTKKVLEES